MKAALLRERAGALISALADTWPLFLLGRRGGSRGHSCPSVKWGEIIHPVGTRLYEAPFKALGANCSVLSEELLPVFPTAADARAS